MMKPARCCGAFLFGPLLTFHASATDSYVCVAKLTTGLAFDGAKKNSKSADFRSEKKLVIARSKQKSHAWEAKEVGDSRPGATCENEFNEAGNLFCSGVFDIRFLYFYPIGYWSDGEKVGMSREGENTSALAIGKCSAV